MADVDPTIQRLEDQIAWYDARSKYNQRCFKWLKVAVIASGAVIPFLAGIGAPAFWIGGLGVLIVVVEGVQQLNQYQHNWIVYRSTCESLRHEKHLYLANAGPYTNVDGSHALLAERVESLVSQEHAKWVSAQQSAGRDRNAGR